MEENKEKQQHPPETLHKDEGKLEIIAHKSFGSNPELVYVVDFLNKNLKNKGVMFGLTREKDKEQMVIKIYEF